MIALGLALISFVAGVALHGQPEFALLRAALYGLGAASLAAWLLRRLSRRNVSHSNDLPPRLIVLAGVPRYVGKVVLLDRIAQSLGKLPCRIQRTAHGYTITDLGAQHDIYLNGRRLTPNLPVPLHSGDEIAFGVPSADSLVLSFRAELFPESPVAPAETQRTESLVSEPPASEPEASRAQFLQHVQAEARRTSVLPLILPSRAEEPPRPEPDRHDP
jgi:hypothetical protein